MSLNLNAIHYPVNHSKRTGRGWGSKRNFPRSKEEIFQLEHLAPATHSFAARNVYRLDLNLRMDNCCVTSPDFSVPLTIIPISYDPCPGFMEPVDYHPIELGYFRFDLNILHRQYR